jgi:hypothetical protein
MKKIFAALALSVTLLRSYADEGMWLPLLLGKQVCHETKASYITNSRLYF